MKIDGATVTKKNLRIALKNRSDCDWVAMEFLPQSLADRYLADCKLLDDRYAADREPLYARYQADRKPLDDRYAADCRLLDDRYLYDCVMIFYRLSKEVK